MGRWLDEAKDIDRGGGLIDFLEELGERQGQAGSHDRQMNDDAGSNRNRDPRVRQVGGDERMFGRLCSIPHSSLEELHRPAAVGANRHESGESVGHVAVLGVLTGGEVDGVRIAAGDRAVEGLLARRSKDPGRALGDERGIGIRLVEIPSQIPELGSARTSGSDTRTR